MEKRILIGSIIAVVILVLVSFTGVVGYQTTKSSTIARASPLFSIRTQRAIDRDSKDLNCEYVGKGEESILSIPKRDNRIDMVQKAIDVISKMDDETYNRFIGSIISRINRNIIDDKEIADVLKQLKDNKEVDNITPWPSWDERRECTSYPCTSDAWYPGCLILDFFRAIYFFIYVKIINIIRFFSIGYIFTWCI